MKALFSISLMASPFLSVQGQEGCMPLILPAQHIVKLEDIEYDTQIQALTQTNFGELVFAGVFKDDNKEETRMFLQTLKPEKNGKRYQTSAWQITQTKSLLVQKIYIYEENYEETVIYLFLENQWKILLLDYNQETKEVDLKGEVIASSKNQVNGSQLLIPENEGSSLFFSLDNQRWQISHLIARETGIEFERVKLEHFYFDDDVSEYELVEIFSLVPSQPSMIQIGTIQSNDDTFRIKVFLFSYSYSDEEDKWSYNQFGSNFFFQETIQKNIGRQVRRIKISEMVTRIDGKNQLLSYCRQTFEGESNASELEVVNFAFNEDVYQSSFGDVVDLFQPDRLIYSSQMNVEVMNFELEEKNNWEEDSIWLLFKTFNINYETIYLFEFSYYEPSQKPTKFYQLTQSKPESINHLQQSATMFDSNYIFFIESDQVTLNAFAAKYENIGWEINSQYSSTCSDYKTYNNLPNSFQNLGLIDDPDNKFIFEPKFGSELTSEKPIKTNTLRLRLQYLAKDTRFFDLEIKEGVTYPYALKYCPQADLKTFIQAVDAINQDDSIVIEKTNIRPLFFNFERYIVYREECFYQENPPILKFRKINEVEKFHFLEEVNSYEEITCRGQIVDQEDEYFYVQEWEDVYELKVKKKGQIADFQLEIQVSDYAFCSDFIYRLGQEAEEMDYEIVLGEFKSTLSDFYTNLEETSVYYLPALKETDSLYLMNRIYSPDLPSFCQAEFLKRRIVCNPTVVDDISYSKNGISIQFVEIQIQTLNYDEFRAKEEHINRFQLKLIVNGQQLLVEKDSFIDKVLQENVYQRQNNETLVYDPIEDQKGELQIKTINIDLEKGSLSMLTNYPCKINFNKTFSQKYYSLIVTQIDNPFDSGNLVQSYHPIQKKFMSNLIKIEDISFLWKGYKVFDPSYELEFELRVLPGLVQTHHELAQNKYFGFKQKIKELDLNLKGLDKLEKATKILVLFFFLAFTVTIPSYLYLWKFIEVFQQYSFLFLIQTDGFPYQFTKIFKTFVPGVTLKIYDVNKLFQFDSLFTPTGAYSQEFKLLGYNSIHFLQNIGFSFLIFILILSLSIFFNSIAKGRNVAKNMANSLLLRFYLLIYLEWSFLAFVNVLNFDEEKLQTFFDNLSYALAILFTLISLNTPFLIKLATKKYLFSKHGEEPNPALETFYLGLNLENRGSKMHYYNQTLNSLLLAFSYVVFKDFYFGKVYILKYIAFKQSQEMITERRYRHNILNSIEKRIKFTFFVQVFCFTLNPVTEEFSFRICFLAIQLLTVLFLLFQITLATFLFLLKRIFSLIYRDDQFAERPIETSIQSESTKSEKRSDQPIQKQSTYGIEDLNKDLERKYVMTKEKSKQISSLNKMKTIRFEDSVKKLRRNLTLDSSIKVLGKGEVWGVCSSEKQAQKQKERQNEMFEVREENEDLESKGRYVERFIEESKIVTEFTEEEEEGEEEEESAEDEQYDNNFFGAVRKYNRKRTKNKLQIRLPQLQPERPMIKIKLNNQSGSSGLKTRTLLDQSLAVENTIYRKPYTFFYGSMNKSGGSNVQNMRQPQLNQPAFRKTNTFNFGQENKLVYGKKKKMSKEEEDIDIFYQQDKPYDSEMRSNNSREFLLPPTRSLQPVVKQRTNLSREEQMEQALIDQAIKESLAASGPKKSEYLEVPQMHKSMRLSISSNNSGVKKSPQARFPNISPNQ